MSDTIFAPATAPGRAAVAVVRLSGPGTGDALVGLCGGLPSPRLASLRKLRDAGGQLLDEALVLWFPGPGSYTGEDAAELQVHGGSAVVERVLEALAAQGLRLAEPGEFTRRAFQNGRMDLAQAEAVADLVDAETDAQAKQALTQLGGGLSRRYDAWRTSLIDALAVLDAAVDFPDEDLPEDVAARARPTLAALLVEIGQALDGADRGRRVREGFRVALIGAPNAGKSSLLNALAGRDAAIVTATPGTTRDVIEVPLTLSGYRVLLADTAGIRETDEAIEAEGVRRARAWAEGADLRLWVVDGSLTPRADEAESLLQAGDIRLLNKADLGLENHPGRKDLDTFSLSLMDGEGVEALKTILASRVVEALSGAEFPAATRIRHAESLSEAHFRLSAALAEVEAPELAAENVRLAARALARVTGRIDAEDVLDKVFSSFCIGK